jgi:hypothetical protein
VTIPYERTGVLQNLDQSVAPGSRKEMDPDTLQQYAAPFLKHFPRAADTQSVFYIASYLCAARTKCMRTQAPAEAEQLPSGWYRLLRKLGFFYSYRS